MPGPWGLTPAGFNIKPVAEILSDINSSQLANISPTLDVQPTALMGILNGEVAGMAAQGWELAGALYNGMDPDNAADDQLASLALITGTVKRPAESTVVTSVVVGVDQGFVADPGTMFAHMIGDAVHLAYNLDGVDNSAGPPGPTNFVINFIFQDPGPIQCVANALQEIAQPLTGWNSVLNLSDGHIGKNIEADADLRIRRQQELELAGSGTADAIRADVLEKMQKPATSVGTSTVTVLYNNTDVPDLNGVPPHSVEVIADSPGATPDDDMALAKLIFSDKCAGDGTNGTFRVDVPDSQGNLTAIYFTRPLLVDLYVTAVIVTDSRFPTGGNTLVKNALAAAVDKFVPGQEAWAKELAAAMFAVPGVNDYTTFFIGIAPAPVSGANIASDIRKKFKLDQANIVITP